MSETPIAAVASKRPKRSTYAWIHCLLILAAYAFRFPALFEPRLGADEGTTVLASDPQLFSLGAELFAQRSDKRWLLTDCISFVVMRQHGISEALTADHHFEQAGFSVLLK